LLHWSGTTAMHAQQHISAKFVSWQVLLVTNFQDFPATAVTVEFWMWSVDNCNQGVPFSYATGAYSQGDNAFLIYNYNNW
jgi:hypothetical protein